MKDTTKYKSVSFPAPKKINLANPVKGTTVLNSTSKSVFGLGQKTVQGKMTKADPFMMRAGKQKHRGVLQKGFKGAEKIFTSALKTHERRLDKRGSLGY